MQIIIYNLDDDMIKPIENIQNRRLMNAVHSGDIQKVNKLLDHGANVNAYDRRGHTALMDAALVGNLDMVLTLLNRGGWAGLEHRSRFGGWTALAFGVVGGNENVVRSILLYGANVDARGTNNRTALMLAAIKGQERIAQTLVEFRADIYATDRQDNTAQILAQYNENYTTNVFLSNVARSMQQVAFAGAYRY